MKSIAKSLIAIAFLFGAYTLGSSMLDTWLTSSQTKFKNCADYGRIYLAPNPPDHGSDFNKCLLVQAEKFLNRDYADFKDLGKAFLTLLSATLVASITFSEKIVDVGKAELLPLFTMISCWVLLLMAIIFLIFGMAYMGHAAWSATYDPDVDFLKSENSGVRYLFMSIGAFVTSLFALVTAGVVSLFQRRSMNQQS